MKPNLRKSLPQPEQSFVLRKDVGKDIRTDWHFHPDYELALIKNSRGNWLVGDYNGPFVTGDVIFMGPNLPHAYRHEHKYLSDSAKTRGEVIAILFLKEIFGHALLSLPECSGIQEVLTRSERGLRLKDTAREEAGQLINDMFRVSRGQRLIQLLSILQLIADSGAHEPLASSGFRGQPADHIDNARINTIIEYTYNNFQRPITIEEVAGMLHMSRPSFSRFFKERTHKTYLQFLMEVRIGNACRMLIEEDINIAEVCYASGYNSVSHFNHQFKAVKQQSPYEYKQAFHIQTPLC